MVPGAPRAWSHLARAVSRASAVNTSAGGSSRPARAALPDASSQTVTAAPARASSARRPAAAGSAARTARRSAARSCPVVHPPAPARPRYRPAIAAATPSSGRGASSSANTAAFAQSIPPAFNAVRTSGVRARAEARVRSRPADRPVRVSAAAISSVTCSACRDLAGPADAAARRFARVRTAAASPAAAHDAIRRQPHSTPISSDSPSCPCPPVAAAVAVASASASHGPGARVSRTPPAANPAPDGPARRWCRNPAGIDSPLPVHAPAR